MKKIKKSLCKIIVAVLFIGLNWTTISAVGETRAIFSDTEKISVSVSAGHWGVMLNEVLPNPEGIDSQTGLSGEWVELYNNWDNSIDLTGWYIKDEAGAIRIIGNADTTWNNQTTIPANGWLVVFMNDDILNNNGTEIIYLFDNKDKLQDSYSYGINTNNNDDDGDLDNTPGEENEFAGTEATKQEGKSDARIPDGIGVWVDPIPTPGAPNVDGEVKLETKSEKLEPKVEPVLRAEVEAELEPEPELPADIVATTEEITNEEPPVVEAEQPAEAQETEDLTQDETLTQEENNNIEEESNEIASGQANDDEGNSGETNETENTETQEVVETEQPVIEQEVIVEPEDNLQPELEPEPEPVLGPEPVSAETDNGAGEILE